MTGCAAWLRIVAWFEAMGHCARRFIVIVWEKMPAGYPVVAKSYFRNGIYPLKLARGLPTQN
jgi:hypothetical protein